MGTFVVDHLEERDLGAAEALEVPDVFGLAWKKVTVPKFHGVVAGAILPDFAADPVGMISLGDVDTFSLDLDFGFGLVFGLCFGLQLGLSFSPRLLSESRLACSVSNADGAAYMRGLIPRLFTKIFREALGLSILGSLLYLG